MYNDYASLGSPGSCAVPSQGTGDNGNVRGYLYQDSVNSSLSHAATYSYDSLNRLTNAAATGSSTYNFTFQYDRWGNMTCTINGQTNGPCPEYSFNSNNQITNTGYTYDAAGDLTSDGTNTYQYDAEGREISVNGSSNWAATHNALGQVVQRYYAPQGETDNFVWDLSGQFIANWSQNFGWWWDEFVRSGADGRLLADNRQAEDTTWFLHLDQINSWKSVTAAAGQMMQDSLLYPWGSLWTQAGMGWGAMFADMPICCGEVGQYVTSYRPYAISQGRWMGPDLLGGDITNPQSLNRYAYALNNPTTLTDPLGLDGGNPLCGNLYDWPGGSYEGSAPSEDCGLDSYPFIPPTFPPIGVIIGGGATSTASPAPTPASPSSTGGEEFRRQPIPCVNVSALAAALTIQLAATLGVPPSSITLTPAGSKGGAEDFNVTLANATGPAANTITPTNIPYINNQVSQELHPGEHSQFWFPTPKDSVPGLGHTAHVLFNQGPVSPATGLPTISNVQVHADIGNPMTAEGSVNPLGAVWHGVADVAAMSILSSVEGCPLKFQ